MLDLSEQAIEKQNSVNQLTALKREKQQETQRLEDEIQRQQSMVERLNAKSEKEQAKAAAAAAGKAQKSVTDKN